MPSVTTHTILQFSSSSGPGGAERVVNALASALSTCLSYRCLVCLFRPGWLKEQCESRGVPVEVLSAKRLRHLWIVNDVLHLVRRKQVALIHAHEFDAIVYGTFVAYLAGIPVVATIHGKNYFFEKSRRRMAYRLASRYAKMIAVSEDLKKFVVDRVGIQESRIGVVYNGVEAVPASVMCSTASLRDELGLTPHGGIVGVVASLYPVKGHRYLLEGIPAILQRLPATNFLFIGRGQLADVLRRQAKDLGVDHRVHFLGLRNDIQQLLALMNVFVLPSLSEGLSISILEAMMMGKPVVATEVGGNPELVRDGETGILVPSRDSQALASGIVTLLEDQQKAVRLGNNGRKRAETWFQLQTMVNNYSHLYADCLNVETMG